MKIFGRQEQKWLHLMMKCVVNDKFVCYQLTNSIFLNKQFYFIINVAVGGTNGFFLDTMNKGGRKTWNDSSEFAMRDFWRGRFQWLPTWQLDNAERSSLIIDSVKVWAL